MLALTGALAAMASSTQPMPRVKQDTMGGMVTMPSYLMARPPC